MDSASTFHLSLGDHVHLDSGQKNPGTAKSFEPQHGPRSSLDRAMILLHEIVEIFGLTDLDRRFAIGIDGFDCGEIGATFVDGHCVGHVAIDFSK